LPESERRERSHGREGEEEEEGSVSEERPANPCHELLELFEGGLEASAKLLALISKSAKPRSARAKLIDQCANASSA
jgi:hypothetical protein